MKRKELARIGRFQVRTAVVVAVIFLSGFALAEAGILQKYVPSWSPNVVVPWLGGGAIVVILVLGFRGFVGLPKCPHCGALLTSWLLHIAVASGNCGMCGESIETEEC